MGMRLGKKVLDTFSTVQSLAYTMLAFFALRLELSNLRMAPPQVTNMSLRTPDALYIVTRNKFQLAKNSCLHSVYHSPCSFNLPLTKHDKFHLATSLQNIILAESDCTEI